MTPQNTGAAAEVRIDSPPTSATGAGTAQSVLADAAGHVSLDVARSIVESRYGVDSKLSRLSGERDDNFRVETARGTWMLKIAHGAEARVVTEFQSAVLVHLADSPVSVPRVIPTVDGEDHEWIPKGPAAGRAIRMTTFSPGVVLREAPALPGLAREIGFGTAELGDALASFRHPGADAELLWDVQQAHLTRELLDDRPYLPDASILRSGFDEFLDSGAQRLAALPRQVIHNDANPDNILVDVASSPRISFVDFGDAVVAPRVVDLAVAASYHLDSPGEADPSAPLGAATDVVMGYTERTPLEADEIRLLHDLLTARVLTAITIASWRAARFPDNDDYILRNTASAWRRLEILRSADRRTVTDDLLRRCATR